MFTHHYPARCFGMNMPKSRDIQAKMPSPKVILNAFWLVTVKVLNSYVLEYGQSKIEYLKTPHGAYDRNMEMIYLL